MQTIIHSQLKSAMCLQTLAWSRGFTSANSIPGSPGSFEGEKILKV
jgi:hypothetical protein